MNEEKIKEVFSDEEFVNSLMELETPEEVRKALEEKDIDLNVEDIKKIADLLQKKATGELTDEDLESVAGGSMAVLAVGCIAMMLAPGVAYTVNQARRRRW